MSPTFIPFRMHFLAWILLCCSPPPSIFTICILSEVNLSLSLLWFKLNLLLSLFADRVLTCIENNGPNISTSMFIEKRKPVEISFGLRNHRLYKHKLEIYQQMFGKRGEITFREWEHTMWFNWIAECLSVLINICFHTHSMHKFYEGNLNLPSALLLVCQYQFGYAHVKERKHSMDVMRICNIYCFFNSISTHTLKF